jgi:hypothetical protein
MLYSCLIVSHGYLLRVSMWKKYIDKVSRGRDFIILFIVPNKSYGQYPPLFTNHGVLFGDIVVPDMSHPDTKPHENRYNNPHYCGYQCRKYLFCILCRALPDLLVLYIS